MKILRVTICGLLAVLVLNVVLFSNTSLLASPSVCIAECNGFNLQCQSNGEGCGAIDNVGCWGNEPVLCHKVCSDGKDAACIPGELEGN